MNRSGTVSVFSLITLAALGCGAAGQDRGPSILDGRGDSVRVRLVDAATARPLAHMDVTVQSDDGIVCITAPCPRDSRQLDGAVGRDCAHRDPQARAAEPDQDRDGRSQRGSDRGLPTG
jgi:hypothetical protein